MLLAQYGIQYRIRGGTAKNVAQEYGRESLPFLIKRRRKPSNDAVRLMVPFVKSLLKGLCLRDSCRILPVVCSVLSQSASEEFACHFQHLPFHLLLIDVSHNAESHPVRGEFVFYESYKLIPSDSFH